MESENLDNKVPRRVKALFDHFLVIGIGRPDPLNPDSVTILYLESDAEVTASECLNAMKSRNPKSFDGRFYDSNLQIGYYIVNGKPVDICSLKTKRTDALENMYGNYMGMYRMNESGCSTFLNTMKDWLLDLSEFHLNREN